jgi:hypothetical protein
MILLPLPAKITETGENFSAGPDFKIVLDCRCGFPEFRAAKLLRAELRQAVCIDPAIEKSTLPDAPCLFLERTDLQDESYRLKIDSNGAKLSGGGTGIFRGIQTLRQIIRQCGADWPGLSVEDEPKFATRGFFHDVTRGKVPTLATLKDLADRLAFYKINQLQLYVEHTFAFRGFSEVWTGKDPLTAEDILELDEYCRQRHIELVPSLATFGHLYEVLATRSWRKYCELEVGGAEPFAWYSRMSHYTLDPTDPGSFGMVCDMLDQYLPLFSSRKVNIGCDETFDVGRGKTRELAGRIGRDGIYVDFLKKIIAYLQSEGKEVMFWGDIILKTPDSLRKLPENVKCLYWNYSADVPESEISTLAQSGVDFLVCPGVGGWNMMMNLFENAFTNISKMVRFGRKYGAEGVLNTDWGDFGHINAFANSMPGMAAGAALSWNPDDGRPWRRMTEDYFSMEFGEGAGKLAALLEELSARQAGTWAEVVCWRESKLLHNDAAVRDEGRILSVDGRAALAGYRRALEIEKLLAAVPCPPGRREDMREYVCSARGAALMDAACLAIKKYAYGFADTQLALECGELAVQLELWFRRFSALWRVRNRESELYRIRDTLQDLCAFLRDHSGTEKTSS